MSLLEDQEGYTVRNAHSSDKDAIAGLWVELIRMHRAQDSRFTLAPNAEKIYARHAQEMIRSRDGYVFVALENATGQIVGFIMGDLQNRPAYSLPGRYGFISDVYVLEPHRHSGIGRALFAAIKAAFVERKADAIQLYAAEANANGLAFWESLGMEPFLRLYHLELSTESLPS